MFKESIKSEIVSDNSSIRNEEKIRAFITERIKIVYKFLSIVSIGFAAVFMMAYYNYQQFASSIVDEIEKSQSNTPSFGTMVLFTCVLSALFVCMISALQSLSKDGELLRINYELVNSESIDNADFYYISLIPTVFYSIICVILCFWTLSQFNTIWIGLLNPKLIMPVLALFIAAYGILNTLILKYKSQKILVMQKSLMIISITLFVSMCECVSLGIYCFENLKEPVLNMELFDVISILLSFVSLCVSGLVLIQSMRQNKKQNNQFLFEKRFTAYKLVRNIYNCAQNASIYFTSTDKDIFLAKDAFVILVNFSPMHMAANGIEAPLTNSGYHKNYLTIKQTIDDISNESLLIFDKNYDWISQYINAYIKLLDEVRNYQIWQSQYDKNFNKKKPPSLDKIHKDQQPYHRNVLSAWAEFKSLNERINLPDLQKLLKL